MSTRKRRRKTKDFTILMPVTNSLKFVQAALFSLEKFSFRKPQVILVGSSPLTLGEDVRVVTGDPFNFENVVRAGLENAENEFILFSESDLIFGPKWDVPLRKRMKSDLILSTLQFQDYTTLGWRILLRNPLSGTWAFSLPRRPEDLDLKWWVSICEDLKKEFKGKVVRGWHREQFLIHRCWLEKFKDGDLFSFLISLNLDFQILLDSQILHLVE